MVIYQLCICRRLVQFMFCCDVLLVTLTEKVRLKSVSSQQPSVEAGLDYIVHFSGYSAGLYFCSLGGFYLLKHICGVKQKNKK